MCPADRPYSFNSEGDTYCCPSTTFVHPSYNFAEINTCHKCEATIDSNCDDYKSKFGVRFRRDLFIVGDCIFRYLSYGHGSDNS